MGLGDWQRGSVRRAASGFARGGGGGLMEQQPPLDRMPCTQDPGGRNESAFSTLKRMCWGGRGGEGRGGEGLTRPVGGFETCASQFGAVPAGS